MAPNERSELSRVRGDYVMLKAQGLNLLLPQGDVGKAEYLDEVPESCGLIGLFEFDSRRGDSERVIGALDARMQLMRTFPTDRFLLTAFTERNDFELCWNEVEVLIDVSLQPRSLPLVMQTPGAILRQFVEWKDSIAFLCRGKDLLEHCFAALL